MGNSSTTIVNNQHVNLTYQTNSSCLLRWDLFKEYVNVPKILPPHPSFVNLIDLPSEKDIGASGIYSHLNIVNHIHKLSLSFLGLIHSQVLYISRKIFARLINRRINHQWIINLFPRLFLWGNERSRSELHT